MTRRSLILAIIASALISAIITSLISINWHRHDEAGHGESDQSADNFHHWLHQNLDLTSAQEKALLPIEEAFEKEQSRLQKSITKAADELAHEIKNSPREKPSITTALARLNALQNELQKLTLAHFYDMKSELNPAQAEKLRQWTHDSIVGNHSH